MLFAVSHCPGSRLWPLLHCQYWILTTSPIRYPVVALGYGDPVASVLQNWPPPRAPAVHRWGKCWGGPIQHPGSGPGWQQSCSPAAPPTPPGPALLLSCPWGWLSCTHATRSSCTSRSQGWPSQALQLMRSGAGSPAPTPPGPVVPHRPRKGRSQLTPGTIFLYIILAYLAFS